MDKDLQRTSGLRNGKPTGRGLGSERGQQPGQPLWPNVRGSTSLQDGIQHLGGVRGDVRISEAAKGAGAGRAHTVPTAPALYRGQRTAPSAF